MNFGLLLVSFGHLLVSFELLLVNLKILLVNLCVLVNSQLLLREFLSFLLGESSNTRCLYLFFFHIPVRIKETKKRRDSLKKESRLF
ncbi:MAG: hypothetical protein ACQEXK_05440 [Bacillota bacterium]